ncbi:MAG: oligosaccharide flippase family protein [Pseudomonadota bacterium]
MEAHKNIRSSVLWALLESVVSLASALAVAVIVARLISPNAFGIAAIASFIGILAETFIITTFCEALIRRRRLQNGTVDIAHTSTLILSLGIYGLVCIAAFVAAHAYSAPILLPLILAQGTSCLFLGLRCTSEAVLSNQLQFKTLSIRSICAKSAGAAVSIYIAYQGGGAWSIVIGNVAFSAIATALVLTTVPRRPKLRMDLRVTRRLFSYGRFSLLDAVLWTATPRLFGFQVAYFQGLDAVGFLNFAFRINDTVCALLGAISTRMALPLLSRYTHDEQQFRYAFQQGTKFVFLLAAPVFIGLALTSNDLVRLLVGPEWEPAGIALAAAAIYSLFNFARLMVQPAIKAVGKPSKLVLLHTIGLLYVSLASVVAAPFGLEGQLAAWCLFGPVYFAASVYVLHSAVPIPLSYQLSPLVGASVGAGVMASVLLAAQAGWPDAPPIAFLVVQIVMGALIYTSMLFVLERRSLMQILGREEARRL